MKTIEQPLIINDLFRGNRAGTGFGDEIGFVLFDALCAAVL